MRAKKVALPCGAGPPGPPPAFWWCREWKSRSRSFGPFPGNAGLIPMSKRRDSGSEDGESCRGVSVQITSVTETVPKMPQAVTLSKSHAQSPI